MAAGTTIQHKRKAGAFTGGQLAAGEIGVDTTNGALYFSTDGATVATLTPHAAVTLGASLTDVLSLSGQVLSAVDAGSDKIKFWDDSAGKETYATIGAGLTMTETTLAASSGSVLQVKSTVYSTQTSGSTTFPLDNTIPQNTEGTELVTLSITPSNASNRLLIVGNFIIHSSAIAACGPALFQDSTANALSYAIQIIGAGYGAPATLVHEMAAGTTSATTFKIRVGTHSGTWYVNQTNANTLGGAPKSVLTIFEIAA